MVVSLGKNIALQDTSDTFVKKLNNNFEEMYGYVNTNLKHSLPPTYQQVEWIGFNGSQYIDTGFKANTTTTRYETKIEHTTNSTQALFGSRETVGAADTTSCNIFLISGSYRLDWVDGNGNLTSGSISTNTPYTISITRGLATINGTDYTSPTTTSVNQTHNFLIGNFTNGSDTPFSGGFVGKLYYSKLYSNNVLVKDYVPCYRKSDNIIGLYDLVNGEFKAGVGSGLTKGNDVESPISLYDVLYSISTIVTIGYKNLPNNSTMKWFVNGISTTSRTVNTNTGAWVSYKLTTPSGVNVTDFIATQNETVDLSSVSPNTVKLTIVPTQSDTTVEIGVWGNNPYEFEQIGNTISVSPFTIVYYRVSKEGYDTVEESMMMFDNQTISVTCPEKKYGLTIVPTPEDATVTLTASGYEQVGNTIRVPSGTTVHWEVSKEGYATKSGNETITQDITKPVEIIQKVTLTIVPTPSNSTVTMAAPGYSQVGNTITVGKGTNVMWMVSCDGYYPQSGNYIVNKDYEMKVKLTGV